MLAALREGSWLTPARARLYALAVAVVVLAVGAAVLARIAGLLAADGRPLRTDFVAFWLAGLAALRGEAAAAYDWAAGQAAQAAMFDAASMRLGRLDFVYPPTYLLLCLPLALLPYVWSGLAWLGASSVAWIAAMRLLLPRPAALVPLIGFPAALTNLRYLQNGCLSGALLAAAAALLDRRPLLAGACIGALACKPQLGVFAPLVLALTGRWASFAAAAATALGVVAASVAAFGIEPWRAFLANLAMQGGALADNEVSVLSAQTVAVAARGFGLGAPLAWGLQALAAAAALAALLAVLRHRRDGAAAIAALAAATMAGVPYVNVYDSMILAVPLAWLFAEGLRDGFLPWEKTLMVVAFLLPGLAREIAGATGLPVAALLGGLLLALVLRRARAGRPGSAAVAVP